MENNKYKLEEAKKTIEITLRDLGIWDYIFDETITEIEINPSKDIFIVKNGQGNIFSGKTAESEKTRHLINILASLEGQVIDSRNPRLSSSLPIGDECRFEGLVEPVVRSPSCAIRKKSKKIYNLAEYVEQGMFTEKEKLLIENYVRKKKNILIVGGTNTGKTTFTNAIIKAMSNNDPTERHYIVEEVGELQSENKNVVFVKVLPGIFSTKDALKSAMRFNPDRIIFGELRGAEAFDLLNAFNSGHPGGVTTVHANDCHGGLDKVETYILYEYDRPMSKLIARTINVVITLGFVKNKRKLNSIAEVKDFKNGEYILEFKYKSPFFEEE